jgi:hypothetical protein
MGDELISFETAKLAKELRLGNCVYSCKGGIVTRVGILQLGGQYPYEPIPLTEEVFLKFGARKYQNDHGCDSYSFDVKLSSPLSFYDKNVNGFMCNKTSYFVEYVHQLQNLFFALTGEELKMEL